MPKSKYKPWGKKKFQRCLKDVIDSGTVNNPYAVCTAVLKKAKKKKESRK